MNAVMPSWMRTLPADELAAIPKLIEFESAHSPGLKVVIPRYRDEPWRFVIDPSAVLADDETLTGWRPMPRALLESLEALFAPEHSPP